SLADEPADVELSRLSELSRARIADVGVVRPDDGLGRRARCALEVPCQGFERLSHVCVAEVPALDAAAEDRAVVPLGVGDEPGILLGIEVGVDGDPAIAARELDRLVPELDELLDSLPLAGLGAADPCLVTVDLRA